MSSELRIGSRGSKLALIQSNWVKERLEERFPDLKIAVQIISTKGDRITDVPLSRVGGRGLFTKELESVLLAKDIDMAVHSMKDVPTQILDGLTIGAVTKREDPHDVLIVADNQRAETQVQSAATPLDSLPKGAKVGTSSLRRRAQLLAYRQDIDIVDLRGNLDTRLRKLETGDYSAIVAARAGLSRLGLADRMTWEIPFEMMLPAVGQGALAIEIRADDDHVAEIISVVNHQESSSAVQAERALLAVLEGGCQIPIGAVGQIADNGALALSGVVCSLDGKTVVKGEETGHPDAADEIGKRLAERLLQSGADKVLAEIREQYDSG